jgi:hypothetical protein
MSSKKFRYTFDLPVIFHGNGAFNAKTGLNAGNFFKKISLILCRASLYRRATISTKPPSWGSNVSRANRTIARSSGFGRHGVSQATS